MDSIPGILAIMIPIVAIVAAFAYAAYERWQEGEEKRHSVQAASGGEEARRHLRRIEEDIQLLRTEVGDDIRDVKEQLMRIEKLLRDVG
ncbi:MAG TPA: hypothetical protein VD789_04580 [Thermomicrobiales bacterium]|nr:hypothetical protein [Thermomicrobiales bacterium]